MTTTGKKRGTQKASNLRIPWLIIKKHQHIANVAVLYILMVICEERMYLRSIAIDFKTGYWGRDRHKTTSYTIASPSLILSP